MANIYVITNKLNGRQYVGQCLCSVRERFISHCNDSNRTIPLHADIDLYGSDNFSYELIDTCEDDIRLDVETYYIDKLNTLIPLGYNVYRHSSEGFTGKTHTLEELQKISEKSKQWWNNASDEQKHSRAKKISKKLSGRKFSDEHRAKISEIAKQRTGAKNPFFGKKHSKSTLKQLSDKNSKYDYVMCDMNGSIITTFSKISKAVKYVKELSLTTAKDSSVEYRIRSACYGKDNSAYGYVWKMILKSSSECNDYSDGGEIPQ